MVLLAAGVVGVGVFVLLRSWPGHSSGEGIVRPGALLDTTFLTSEKLDAQMRVAALGEGAKTDYGLPVRLEIPLLGVDAAIEYVGLAADGTMSVPASPEAVAWYEPGPRPGEKGSAVMAGHSGYADGATVFDDLPSLRKGDLLFVEDTRGVRIRFVVRSSRTYDRDADASDVFARDDGHHLNLVTCTGAWDAAAGTHAQRLVVFTDALP